MCIAPIPPKDSANDTWNVWWGIIQAFPDLTDEVIDLATKKVLSRGVKHGNLYRRTENPTPTKTRRMQEVSRHNGLPR